MLNQPLKLMLLKPATIKANMENSAEQRFGTDHW